MIKPLVLIVMDGVGVSLETAGNAVAAARKPTLEALAREGFYTELKAHGTAVGLPSDEDMGNSEVGHNALGCGQVYNQGAMLVNESIQEGLIYTSDVWRELVDGCVRNNGSMHFIGLLSDANVHSNMAHLKAMLARCKEEGVKTAYVHILLDGRDVPATSALLYVDALEAYLAGLNEAGFHAAIASGGGRMTTTMDRYNADWGVVKRGWDTHVRGLGRGFGSASEAIETFRAEEPGVIDQYLPAFVIHKDGKPLGPIVNGDSVILFNFRGDRAIEICRAFDEEGFTAFDRGPRPDVLFAGMLQYDGDAHIPKRFLVSPPDIKHTLTEYLISRGVKEFAVSETQKYGHVTYFWNGNRNGKFSEDMEDYLEIPSDKVPFDERPWMKAAEVTDVVIEAIKTKKYGFIRANFPNGDMVGHTGNFDAAVIAVEAVDLCLKRIREAAAANGVTLVVTADHGNSDEMTETSKTGEVTPKTAHTLNPVPFIVYDGERTFVKKDGNFGLSNVAATLTLLMGLPVPEVWDGPVLGIAE